MTKNEENEADHLIAKLEPEQPLLLTRDRLKIKTGKGIFGVYLDQGGALN